MSASDPAETIEFNLAMRERIIALGAVPAITDLRLPTACNVLHRQLIGLLQGAASLGWASNARAVTGTATILAASDDGMYVDQDVTAAGANANLPAAAALRQGFNFVLRKADATANVITLVPFAGDTVTGPTAITAQFGALMVVRTGPTAWQSIAIPAPGGVDVQSFTVAGAAVWTKPAGAMAVEVICVGGGGGGGGGSRGNASTVQSGGGGGGGGAYSRKVFRAADLGATENLVVGAAGASGAGATVADGADGGNGAASTFGTVVRLFAGGGGGGRRGRAAAEQGTGGGGGGSIGNGQVGQAAAQSNGGLPAGASPSIFAISGQGGAGGHPGSFVGPAEYGGGGGGGHSAVPTNAPGADSIYGAGGGGSGAGSTIAPALVAAAAGGASGAYAAGGGGAAGASGAAPTAGTAGAAGSTAVGGAGGGGGGGTLNAATPGAAGGAGGFPGGGGGGGGIGGDGAAGGAGGVGGGGMVIVIAW